MRRSRKTLTAGLALLALVVSWMPAFAGSNVPGARLEGLLVGVDGRPAGGYAVHLIDAQGADIGRSVVTEDGIGREVAVPMRICSVLEERATPHVHDHRVARATVSDGPDEVVAALPLSAVELGIDPEGDNAGRVIDR